MNNGFSIAIDGPIASGKGTLANSLADKLSGFFMNTGGTYRAVALLCIEKGIDIQDEEKVAEVLSEVNVDFKDKKVFLNSKDITERIKEPDVASASSVVAVYSKVRKNLVIKQQAIMKKMADKGLVVIAEGRDTGTVVMPNASLKIFLTARLEVRANRSLMRYKEKGIVKSLEDVIIETKIRDERDTKREIDPLVSQPLDFGYWILDNSDQTEEQSINSILQELRKRKLINE